MGNRLSPKLKVIGYSNLYSIIVDCVVLLFATILLTCEYFQLDLDLMSTTINSSYASNLLLNYFKQYSHFEPTQPFYLYLFLLFQILNMWRHLLILVVTNAVLCATSKEHLVTSSFEFLDKYTQKQYRNIISLTISNASINKVDPKLKYLKNLEYLDLSHNSVQISSIPSLNNLKVLKLNGNSLKSINMSLLPQNIEDLDLSNNILSHIPKEWRLLKNLKVLHLHKNPIDCDCNNVLNYDRLVKFEISVPETVFCHNPKKYSGKDIAMVNCSLDDIMLYDEPDSGSGASEIFEDNLSKGRNIMLFEEEDPDKSNFTLIDDLIEVHTTTAVPLKEEEDLDEGSGDDGSGGLLFHIPESGVFGCIENCSTPGPVGSEDEDNASALPGPIDQMKMILEDINIFKQFSDDDTSTKLKQELTDPPVQEETKATEVSNKEAEPTDATQPNILRKIDNSSVETTLNSDNTSELERASTAPQNSNAVYAIAGVLTFFAIVFLICFIKKRKGKSKKNRRKNLNTSGEEMKPLSKPTIQTVNEKPINNTPSNPESIPLMNGGQNGTTKGNDSPVLKSYTPLAHPEQHEEPQQNTVEQTDSPVLENDEVVPEPEEVEYRPKSTALLTPPRERVTIRESEIPESIPKTPLLVHRQKTSDGQIITIVP